MISVIIPVYNAEKYLSRCVDSVLRQSYKDLEVILVDDGSTDKSGVICDNYAEIDARIRVIHQKNGGLSAARNAGLKICKGEYVSFIDSDDWIEDGLYENFNLKNSDADIFMFDYAIVSSNTNRNIYQFTEEGNVKKYICLLKMSKGEMPSFAWNKIYRKTLFDGILFPEGRVYEDQAIMHLIVDKAEKIFYKRKVYYNYFQNENSISHNISEKNFRDFVYVNIKRGYFFKNKYPELNKYHLRHIYAGISKLCWLYKDNKVYENRYLFFRKVLFKRLLSNFIKNDIDIKTKIKMLLAILPLNVKKYYVYKKR